VNQQCGYLVAGLFAPIEVVGVFYFAFQLTNAARLLIVQSVQTVLAPLLARVRGDVAAESAAMRSAMRGAFLFFPMVTGATACIFPSLNEFVWKGRWASADESVFLLSIGVTYMGITGIMLGALTGLRQFRGVAWIESIRTFGMIAGTAAGGALCSLAGSRLESATAVTVLSAGTAIGMVVASAGCLWGIGRRLGIERRELAIVMLFGPSFALLVAIATHSIAESMESSVFVITSPASRAVKLGLNVGLYCLLLIVGARFVAEATVVEAVDLLPQSARSRVKRLLNL
jgi:hypothetical protein